MNDQESELIVRFEVEKDEDDGNCEDCTKSNNKQSSSNQSAYIGKKPKWWKQLARRKGTKGQRKAIYEMTQRGYVLPRLDKYLHMIDIQSLVHIPPRGEPLTNDILIPRSEEENQTNETEINNLSEMITHLEIGFGQGENLLTNAMMHPDQFYIGAEIHQPGVGVALGRMKEALSIEDYWTGQNWLDLSYKTHNHTSLSSHIPYDNVRIYPGDGVKILRFLPQSSIHNIYLTFPDPWPKNHQKQYRVIQEDTIELIQYVLKPGGLFYLATDAIVFDEWTRKVFDIIQKKSMEENGFMYWKAMDDCPNRKNWLPVLSKYETKGIEEGRYTICRCWKYIEPDDNDYVDTRRTNKEDE